MQVEAEEGEAHRRSCETTLTQTPGPKQSPEGFCNTEFSLRFCFCKDVLTAERPHLPKRTRVLQRVWASVGGSLGGWVKKDPPGSGSILHIHFRGPRHSQPPQLFHNQLPLSLAVAFSSGVPSVLGSPGCVSPSLVPIVCSSRACSALSAPALASPVPSLEPCPALLHISLKPLFLQVSPQHPLPASLLTWHWFCCLGSPRGKAMIRRFRSIYLGDKGGSGPVLFPWRPRSFKQWLPLSCYKTQQL